MIDLPCVRPPEVDPEEWWILLLHQEMGWAEDAWPEIARMVTWGSVDRAKECEIRAIRTLTRLKQNAKPTLRERVRIAKKENSG